jgi:hypothetical protein
VLKISWTEKKKNDEVFWRMNIQKSIWNTLRLRRKVWIGHVIRNSPWITIKIEGKIEKKPGRGRSKTPFLKQVMEDTGIGTYWVMKRIINDRETK